MEALDSELRLPINLLSDERLPPENVRFPISSGLKNNSGRMIQENVFIVLEGSFIPYIM